MPRRNTLYFDVEDAVFKFIKKLVDNGTLPLPPSVTLQPETKSLAQRVVVRIPPPRIPGAGGYGVSVLVTFDFALIKLRGLMAIWKKWGCLCGDITRTAMRFVGSPAIIAPSFEKKLHDKLGTWLGDKAWGIINDALVAWVKSKALPMLSPSIPSKFTIPCPRGMTLLKCGPTTDTLPPIDVIFFFTVTVTSRLGGHMGRVQANATLEIDVDLKLLKVTLKSVVIKIGDLFKGLTPKTKTGEKAPPDSETPDPPPTPTGEDPPGDDDGDGRTRREFARMSFTGELGLDGIESERAELLTESPPQEHRGCCAGQDVLGGLITGGAEEDPWGAVMGSRAGEIGVPELED